MTGKSIKEAWLWQAATCENMGAPFCAALLRCMVEDEAAKAAIRPLLAPHDDPSIRAILLAALPLRMLGGLHFLVLSGKAPELAHLYDSGDTNTLGPTLAKAAEVHGEILARFLDPPPQTNEVRRSLCLVGGFLTVAKATGLPLRCLELGASAGLNMNWNRYAYLFGEERRWGPTDAALTLSGHWTGGLPPLDAHLEVIETRGCDQAPIDVMSEDGALQLEAYVWPDQKDRLQRIRTAITVARRTGVKVEKADAAHWVKAAGSPQRGVTTVIYHSIFIQYPRLPVRNAILSTIRD